MSFPAYQDIDLTSTPLKWGYYVPGLIEQCRPDIELISIHLDYAEVCDHQGHLTTPHSKFDYSRLALRIDRALASNKKVGLLVEDEFVAYDRNQQLVDIVNCYQDRPVYWLTQFQSNLIEQYYRHQHQLKCQILELPWLLLNEALVYNNFKNHRVPAIISRGRRSYTDQNTFFSLTGKYEPPRKRLIEKLIEYGLDQHGLITIQNTPTELLQYNFGNQVNVEPFYPYGDVPVVGHAKMAAQFYKNNTWLSCNTVNFLHIEKTYQGYPLAIIPETSPYNYFSTEKSLWPALLGKLFLIFGSQGCMQYIQRFYDFDLSQVINLEFDNAVVSCQHTLDHKLELMISKNKDLILNSHRIYDKYYTELLAARQSIGANLYRFVQEQVARIQ